MKFLEVAGVVGGFLLAVAIVVVIAALILWALMTAGGKNPFL